MKMVSPKTIEITVAADGSTLVETKGFLGAECQQASRFLENALGRQVDETLTPDYHVASTERSHVAEEA